MDRFFGVLELEKLSTWEKQQTLARTGLAIVVECVLCSVD